MRQMKNSGIEWIGEIPETWGIVLLSSIFYQHKEKNSSLQETNLLSLSYGKIIKKDINTCEGLLPASFETYNIIDNGDIVFRLTDLQNDQRSLRTGLCTQKGIITSAYITLRNNIELDDRYMHYLYYSYDICKVFYRMGDGVRQGMNFDDLKKLLTLFPPVSEQQRIADFLDDKCAKIDSLIAHEEATIEELKAYKQSVITEAVTKGLDKSVPMKDSGIIWLNEVPKHWRRDIGKHILILHKKTILDSDGVVTCFRDGEVTLRSNRREDGFTFADKEIGYQGIDVGDIAIHGMDGFAGAIGISDSRGKVSPVLSVCNPVDGIDARYIVEYLRMLARNNVFVALATGIRERSCDLRWAKIAVLEVIIPPYEEQKEICDYIDFITKKIDDIIFAKQQKIEELKEYKKSLIYEYVTGKKEVA